MDEAFSALDVLTAENLRTDLLDLWADRSIPLRAILLVSHNIEEAVLMADRIVIFASNPGRIAAEIPVRLPQPRNRQAPEFRRLVEQIYAIMTRRQGDTQARKQLFARQLLKHVPLAAHIRSVLDERPNHRAPAGRFLTELEDSLSEGESERVLDAVINWGRYAEVFAYDDDAEVLSLEDPGEGEEAAATA
jgi:ABC-type proline/glycine betaine transport system ATPase subunit